MFYRSKTRKDFVIILFVLLCSISLLVTYELILWYEAQLNALKASSLANAFQQNLHRKLPRNQPVFTDQFWMM